MISPKSWMSALALPALLGGVALTAAIAAAQTNEGAEPPAADAPATEAPAAETAAPAAEAPAATATEEPAAPAETAQGGEAVNPDEIEIDPIDQPYVVVDGQVDPHTYNGFRRYHSACHVCHGPDGLGSSFAPALVESLKAIDYLEFTDIVVNGRIGPTQDRVMPSFANDPNVMLHLDDIYSYLKARSDEAIPPGRPQRIPAPQ